MPYIRPLFLVVVALLILSGVTYAQTAADLSTYIPLATNGKALTEPTPPPVDTIVYRREVIRLVNEYRVANGCPAAPENPILMDATQVWSDYMQEHNIFEHSSTVDFEWYKHHGYTEGAQENIAAGHETPQEVVQAWKDSPNHNRTLLWCYYANKGYVYDLGVGLNGQLWTLALGEYLP